MNRQEIIDLLRERFGTIKAAAKHFDTQRVLLYQTLNGYGSRKIRLKIAEFFKKRPSEIWQSDSAARAKDDVEYLKTQKNEEN